jgi:hypothetical protein
MSNTKIKYKLYSTIDNEKCNNCIGSSNNDNCETRKKQLLNVYH